MSRPQLTAEIPALALRRAEAAASLGISVETFDSQVGIRASKATRLSNRLPSCRRRRFSQHRDQHRRRPQRPASIVIRRERPVESRSDLVWLDPPRLLSPHRSMFVVSCEACRLLGLLPRFARRVRRSTDQDATR